MDTLPDNVFSLQNQCPSCGSRRVTVDHGPHPVRCVVPGEGHVETELEFPVMDCHDCGESYTDYRAEKIRDTWVEQIFERYFQA